MGQKQKYGSRLLMLIAIDKRMVQQITTDRRRVRGRLSKKERDVWRWREFSSDAISLFKVLIDDLDRNHNMRLVKRLENVHAS